MIWRGRGLIVERSRGLAWIQGKEGKGGMSEKNRGGDKVRGEKKRNKGLLCPIAGEFGILSYCCCSCDFNRMPPGEKTQGRRDTAARKEIMRKKYFSGPTNC